MPFAHKSLASGLELGGYASTMHERVSIQRVAPAADGGARLSGVDLLNASRCILHSRGFRSAAARMLDADLGAEVGSCPMASASSKGLAIDVRCTLTCSAITLCCTADGKSPAYVFVYPNLMINRYGSWMDINVVRSTGPTTCTVRFDWWLDPRHADNADTIRQVSPAHVAA